MSKKLVIVSADWCVGCNALKNQLDKKDVPYEVIDADSEKGMDFCKEHGVKSLPTSFVYEGDEVIGKVIGNKLKEVLEIMEVEVG